MDDLDLGALLRSATELLAAAGVESPRAEAELLAAHVLGAPRGRVAAWAVAGRELTAVQAVDLRRLAISRSTRTPLQYLTGSAAFRTVELSVGPGVFLPRPETELVAGRAVEALAAAGPGALGVDLCTGSGAIAAALAEEVPGARLHAVEADPEAARWAAANLGPRGVELHVADAATALAPLDGSVDVVVSNPPYVPDGRVPLQPEARRDPAMALYGGGADGLRMPAVVAAAAARLLRPGGVFVMEHDDTQAAAVAGLLERDGLFTAVRSHRDLNDRPRFTEAVRTDLPAPRPQGSVTGSVTGSVHDSAAGPGAGPAAAPGAGPAPDAVGGRMDP
ncbi:peptide chain release factor N(5)-glutamine methyltransferase [Citricoccus sp. SGAir0253]|nr:peptide chain release factor N(5)-glutamine methyltransferase [Citricoccus sp. SGAir0253]